MSAPVPDAAEPGAGDADTFMAVEMIVAVQCEREPVPVIRE